MLGAKERQDGVGEMALHQFSGPQLPILQELAQGVVAAFITVAAQQFPGGRRSAGTRIQQRNIHLALRERAVDEWEVADDRREEPETESAFGHNERTRQARARNHITKP